MVKRIWRPEEVRVMVGGSSKSPAAGVITGLALVARMSEIKGLIFACPGVGLAMKTHESGLMMALPYETSSIC